MALFGRKQATPPAGSGGPPEGQKDQPGHQAVLKYLREQEKTEPGVRERLAGRIVFDLAYDILKNDQGVQIEILLAALASVAGQECIAPILAEASDDSTMKQLGLTVMKGKDSRLYFFGDRPNRLLLESQDSFLSLAFGTAQALGAPVTMEMITDELRTVASRIGGPEFEQLDLPSEHMVDRPSEWARVFRPKLTEALDLYDVPLMRRATALGYATQRAIEAGKQTIDPMMAAKIVLQCATRTAKVMIA